MTLFDHLDDDLYDGDFSYDDTDIPRVCIEFKEAPQMQTPTISSPSTSYAKSGSLRETTTTTVIKTTTKTSQSISGGRIGSHVSSISRTGMQTTPGSRSPGGSQSSSSRPGTQGGFSSQYEVSSITRTAPYEPNLQFEIGEKPTNSNNFKVKSLVKELRGQTASAIGGIQSEQVQRFRINEEGLSTLTLLDRPHQELQGEQEQDVIELQRLEGISQEIQTEISNRKAQIEADIQELNQKNQDVDEKMKENEAEKISKTDENRKLQDKLDIPEDLNEEGLSQDAIDLRKENNTLRNLFEKTSSDLVQEMDERDQALADHSAEVEGFNQTIYTSIDTLFKVEEAARINGNHANELKFKVKNLENSNDTLDQKAQISEIDLESLKLEVETLRNDLDFNEKIHTQHISQLQTYVTEQNREIGELKDRFNDVEFKNRHLKVEIEKQTLDLQAHEREMDSIEAIGYDEKASQLQSDLKRVEDVRKQHQDELENAQAKLSVKLQLFQDLTAQRKREKEVQQKRVDNDLEKIMDLQLEINTLLSQIDEINSKIISDCNKDTVGASLENERDSLNLKVRWAQEERENSRKDIQEAIELLKAKNQEAKDQEAQIERLNKEVQSLRTLVEEKKTVMAELEGQIQE